jgi:hypothetical protein
VRFVKQEHHCHNDRLASMQSVIATAAAAVLAAMCELSFMPLHKLVVLRRQ